MATEAKTYSVSCRYNKEKKVEQELKLDIDGKSETNNLICTVQQDAAI
jgi:hypothetical protein